MWIPVTARWFARATYSRRKGAPFNVCTRQCNAEGLDAWSRPLHAKFTRVVNVWAEAAPAAAVAIAAAPSIHPTPLEHPLSLSTFPFTLIRFRSPLFFRGTFSYESLPDLGNNESRRKVPLL